MLVHVAPRAMTFARHALRLRHAQHQLWVAHLAFGVDTIWHYFQRLTSRSSLTVRCAYTGSSIADMLHTSSAFSNLAVGCLNILGDPLNV